MLSKFAVKVLNAKIPGQRGYQLYPRNKKFDMEEYRRLYQEALPDPTLPSWNAFWTYRKPKSSFSSGQSGVVKVSVDRTQKLDLFDLKPYEKLYRQKLYAEKSKGSLLKKSRLKSVITKSPEFATMRKSLVKKRHRSIASGTKKKPQPPKRDSTAVLDELSLKSV